MGQVVVTPHRISLRHSARLLRLPLKGGVILEFSYGRFRRIVGGMTCWGGYCALQGMARVGWLA